jgi:hypothetical protein
MEYQMFMAEKSIDDGDEVGNEGNPYIVLFIPLEIVQENKNCVTKERIPGSDNKETEFLVLVPYLRQFCHCVLCGVDLLGWA